jgi:NTP pyrophosphatase (non-canonical NTP hydrolase)
MRKIIEDNYQSTVKRGLINEETKISDFIMKLEEEVQEFIEAETLSLPNANEELADIILVCLNFAKHYEIDIEQELTNKIKKNETR